MALANKTPEEVRDGLESWLATQLPGATLTSCEIPSASGMSNLTILFSAETGAGEEHFVARVAPDGPAVFLEYDLAKEATVMRALASVDVKVPVVRWVEQDASWLGAQFLVMERAYGRVPADDPPFTAVGWVLEDLDDAQRRELCVNSLKELATIHDADWKGLGLGFLAPDAGATAEAVLDADFELWERVYDWAREGDVNATVEAGFAWLRENRPADDREPVLVWGDARIGNMMFADDLSVNAILDWEMVTLGQPDAEVGWWLFLLRHHTEGIGMPYPPGFPTREEVIATYEQASGRPVPHVDYYEVWAAVRLAALMHRAGNLMIEIGLLPPDAPMKYSNPASQLLAKLIGAPAPTGDSQSFIGNRG